MELAGENNLKLQLFDEYVHKIIEDFKKKTYMDTNTSVRLFN